MRSPVFKPGADAEFVSVEEGYDRWATLYDAEDNPLIALEEPRVDELLGDVDGRDLLELGSGTGRHTLRLAARGARVTALEISAEMTARAAAKPGWEAVRFLRHDLADALPLPDAAFDVVGSFLVLEHIADLPAFFGECARVCRPHGRIALTTLHPAMLLRGIQAHFRDPASGRDVCPRSCPHQISDYVLAALRAGLSIETLGEFAVEADLARRSARAAKYEGWPMLLTMGLRPGATGAPAAVGRARRATRRQHALSSAAPDTIRRQVPRRPTEGAKMLSRELLTLTFQAGLEYPRYLATGTPDQQAAWRRIEAQARLAPAQQALLAGFTRDMPVIVLSGIWCGDCAQQCPLLAGIAAASPRVQLRFVDRDEHAEFARYLRINAGDRVPVVAFMAEDFEPVAVYGDKTLSRYRSLAARQLGPACPLPGAPLAEPELQSTLQDWLNEFERVQLLLRLSGRLRARHGD